MTPAFVARLFQGRFEVRVSDGGKSTLIVTEGSAEIDRTGDAPLMVAAHEFVTARPDEPPAQAERLSLDGVEVALTDVCTGVARANVNVRLAPSESSRRLGGLTEGQRFGARRDRGTSVAANLLPHRRTMTARRTITAGSTARSRSWTRRLRCAHRRAARREDLRRSGRHPARYGRAITRTPCQ